MVSKVLYGVNPHASDSDLIMFTKFVVKETDLLNRESPFDCYFSQNPSKASDRIILDIQARHKEIFEEEQNVEAQIIENHSKTAPRFQMKIGLLLRLNS